MPSIEETLRTIADCKYLIVNKLRDLFYQTPLAKESGKGCATLTPYRGVENVLKQLKMS